jgi:hypothetical protein
VPSELEAELAEIAATKARLDARTRGEDVSAEDYVPTPALIKRSAELARKHHRKYPPPYEAIVIDRASGDVRGIIPNTRTWSDLRTMKARGACTPRRAATTPRARLAGRRPRRVAASRDGPLPPSDDDPDEDLLEDLTRPRLTAALRDYLKREVSDRRREALAANPQVSEADRALFADDVAEEQSVR